jgi:hypothetical protein
VFERGNHPRNSHPVGLPARQLARLQRQLHRLPDQAARFVFEVSGANPSHMLQAMKKVHIGPAVELKGVGADDVSSGCEVVQVYLPDYLRVLLDSVGAPIDATPENLGPDASIQQNGLFAFKLLPNRLITH